MMKSLPAAAPVSGQTVCRPVRLQSLSGGLGEWLQGIPLFWEVSRETLRAELRDAPQFQELCGLSWPEDAQGGLRVLLLGEDRYCTAQAAVYLASLSPGAGEETDEESWGGVDYCDREETECPEELLARSLAVLAPEALDPALRQSKSHDPAEGRPVLRLRTLAAPAALITAASGRVLTPGLLEQIRALDLRDSAAPLDLLIALRDSQVDRELLEELRFTHGFQVVRVGRPDQAYDRRVLRACGERRQCPIAPDADLDRVIAHTRSFRGERFCELDLDALVARAIQNHAKPPLQTQDLLFAPFQSQGDSWEKLERMTGLEGVKEKLLRLLACAVWEERRRQAGRPVRPMCRNLAFAGPPGTGKSVTARLAARILQERGCGSGRFVEAGREQLIGSYLGQTSPKIEQLFAEARGGVLFLDEAGALLDNGQDSYAAEAVNALVRHMELQPETMVIFATYPGEMERLLSSNPGLKSRVAQVLEFRPYDDDQLWEMVRGLAGEYACHIPEGAGEVCRGFFSALRQKDPEGFGNGREARRLFQGALEELALRTMDTGGEDAFRLEDWTRSAGRLLAGAGEKPGMRPIGFR